MSPPPKYVITWNEITGLRVLRQEIYDLFELSDGNSGPPGIGDKIGSLDNRLHGVSAALPL